MAEKNNNKNKFSTFFLSEEMINRLLKYNALEIGAALVLARFSDRTGEFTTAGAGAVARYLGVGRPKAQKALQGLLDKPHLIKPITWVHYSKRPDGPTSGPSGWSYAFEIFKDPGENIWFSGDLITGHGKFKRPLARLMKLGTDAVRILLYMFKVHDLSTWGGLPPDLTFYHSYTSPEYRSHINGIDIYSATREISQTATGNLLDATISPEKGETNDDRYHKRLFPMLYALEQTGFIYEVTTAISGHEENDETVALYHLHHYNYHGNTLEGEENLSGETSNLAKRVGIPMTDQDGNFYGRFAFVVPHGVKGKLIGIFRLRYRAVQPRSTENREQWFNINERQLILRQWLDQATQHDAAVSN